MMSYLFMCNKVRTKRFETWGMLWFPVETWAGRTQRDLVHFARPTRTVLKMRSAFFTVWKADIKHLSLIGSGAARLPNTISRIWEAYVGTLRRSAPSVAYMPAGRVDERIGKRCDCRHIWRTAQHFRKFASKSNQIKKKKIYRKFACVIFIWKVIKLMPV